TRLGIGERSLLSKAAHRFLRAKEGPGQVGVDDPPPVLQGELGERRIALNSSVVDEDVEPSKSVDHLLDHRLAILRFRYIPADGDGLSAAIPNSADDLFGSFLAGIVVDPDLHAASAELLGDGPADARAASGYKCSAAFETQPMHAS